MDSQITYKVIGNLDDLIFWWKYGMAPLKLNEAFFISVSYRNKDLSKEEREIYSLGRSEMCDTETIRHDDFHHLFTSLKRWEYDTAGGQNKKGISKPQKCRRIYINTCPIDLLKASHDLVNEITKFQIGLANSALNHSKNGIEENIYGLKKIMASNRSIYARNHGTRTWIDIDADYDFEDNLKEESLRDIIDSLNIRFGIGNIMAIKTKGGCHFLIRKNSLKCNPEIICHDISMKLSNKGCTVKEVAQNKNEMLPIPGIWMGDDFITTVLNQEDFKDIEPFHI